MGNENHPGKSHLLERIALSFFLTSRIKLYGPSCHSRCRCTQQKLRWRQATTGKVDTSCSAKFKFKCRPGWNQRVSTAHRLGINSPRLSTLNVLLSFSQIYHTGHYGNLTNKIDVCAGENVHVLLPVNDLKTRRARGVWNTQIPRNDGRVIKMKIVLLPAEEKRWLIDI